MSRRWHGTGPPMLLLLLYLADFTRIAANGKRLGHECDAGDVDGG
jgi:hypothetical protein